MNHLLGSVEVSQDGAAAVFSTHPDGAGPTETKERVDKRLQRKAGEELGVAWRDVV